MQIGVYSFADTNQDIGAARRLRDLIEEIELADQVGLDVFGVGEHHRPDYAASAPPQLILTEEGDRADEKRGDTAAAALRTAGSTVFQTSYAQFDVNNERTYLGWITNPATLKLGECLRTYCPARKS